MLIKVKALDQIKKGQISFQFRKWDSPRVKKGSLIKTPIGLINIIEITEVPISTINEKDARDSGHSSLNDLQKELAKRKEGNIYKIQLAFHSEDPRIALRNETTMDNVSFNEIKWKLDRFDQFSKVGPWTLSVLEAIEENPQLKAQHLSEIIAFNKDWLKPNIRKLKNLGLTISHEIGYSISPRGQTFLSLFREENHKSS